MFRALLAISSAFLSFALTSCSKKPAVEYRLTAEQLAWQPYRTGDVLRFGQAQTSKVRTFLVAEVNDRFETYSQGGTAPVYLGPATDYKMQAIDVRVRRTDTLRYKLTATSTPVQPDSIPFTDTTELLKLGAIEGADVYAYVDWDIGFGNALPLRQVIEGQMLFDTTQQLLPTLRLGGIDYGPVLRVSNGLQNFPTGFPRTKPARLIYYAKGHGVVGFVEGSTLWYRLP